MDDTSLADEMLMLGRFRTDFLPETPPHADHNILREMPCSKFNGGRVFC